ncbi:hypothetical protein [Gorillibacterium timonense]|uniref:hypothetical protein n=1 Tax=Gorillibacterium timonense TaxID=1689269 RepID=UPI000A6A5AF5|nr:hypothetical protein [Gorillibacterium timonense]
MPSGWLSPTFVIGQIKIGTVEGASCLNFGNNVPSGFSSRKVHNQGFGSIEGDDNHLSGIRSFLHESPAFGATDEEAGEASPYEVPDWIKEWMTNSMDLDLDMGEEAAPGDEGKEEPGDLENGGADEAPR